MLSAQDNELLCRVGPGTPMGNLMREYWLPALLPDELPTPDGPPVRLRLLGDWLGRFRSRANKDNDYCIDRDLQARMGTWSGVPVVAQDPMVCESMGAIYDRTQERLGTTDAMIVRSRRFLLRAAKALRDQGATPPGVDKPQLYNMYCGAAIIPRGVNGIDATLDVQLGRAQTIELSVVAS